MTEGRRVVFRWNRGQMQMPDYRNASGTPPVLLGQSPEGNYIFEDFARKKTGSQPKMFLVSTTPEHKLLGADTAAHISWNRATRPVTIRQIRSRAIENRPLLVNCPFQELTMATRGSRGFFEAPFVRPVQSESVSDTKVQSTRTPNFVLMALSFRQGACTAGPAV
jgi:hypothetical protein